MPRLVTTKADIRCNHQGRVILTPHQSRVKAHGNWVLREPDLVGAPIQGCTQPASMSSKPCTFVVSINPPGGFSTHIAAVGLPVQLDTLTGVTDGVPPGTIKVVDPGTTVEAS
jgi:hypothetical protein